MRLAWLLGAMACATTGCFAYDSRGVDGDGGGFPDAASDAGPGDPDGGGNSNDWIVPIGGPMDQAGSAVAIGRLGAVYVGGTFEDTIGLDGINLSSVGSADVVAARLVGADGNVVWARSFGSTREERVGAIAVDSDGNLFVAGSFQGLMDVDGILLQSAGSWDGYVAKLAAADGDVMWVRRFGGTGDDRIFGAAVDDADGVVLSGSFSGTVNLGSGSVDSAGGYDMFLTRLSFDNSQFWVRTYGGAGDDKPIAVAVANGEVVVAGSFEGTVSFGGALLPGAAANTSDLILAKYDLADGGHIWSQAHGGVDNDVPFGVAVGADGSIYVTGAYEGDVDFGGGALIGAGGSDAFVARYAEGGAHVWSEGFGGAGDESGQGIALDATGQVLAAGVFTGTVDFGGGPLSADTTDGDGYLIRLNATDGAHRSSRDFGGPGKDQALGVAADGSGRTYVAGFFEMTADFGFDSIASKAAEDGYVLGIMF